MRVVKTYECEVCFLQFKEEEDCAKHEAEDNCDFDEDEDEDEGEDESEDCGGNVVQCEPEQEQKAKFVQDAAKDEESWESWEAEGGWEGEAG